MPIKVQNCPSPHSILGKVHVSFWESSSMVFKSMGFGVRYLQFSSFALYQLGLTLVD